MEFVLLILFGLGALSLAMAFSDSSDTTEEDDTAEDGSTQDSTQGDAPAMPEQLTLSNQAGQWLLTGTAGPDLIDPLLLEEIQLDLRLDASFAPPVPVEVLGAEGDDTIIAAAYGDPEDPDRLLDGQSFLTLRGEDGDDLIISEGNVQNVLDGGAGNDTLVAIDIASEVIGGAGDDVIFARSYFLGEEAATQVIDTGPGDNFVRVFNGFAEITSGNGANTIVLDFFRPDEQDDDFRFPFEAGFRNFGDVLIRNFDPEQDTLAIFLPPEDTDNIELASITQSDVFGIILNLSMTGTPVDGPFGPEYRAEVHLPNVILPNEVEVSFSDGGVLVLIGQTQDFDPANLPTLQSTLATHFPQA